MDNVIVSILAFSLARGFDLGVTTLLITPVMGINWFGSFGKDCFDVLKSTGFGNLVRPLSILRQSDRVYLDWFVWDLVGRLFKMQASKQSEKAC